MGCAASWVIRVKKRALQRSSGCFFKYKSRESCWQVFWSCILFNYLGVQLLVLYTLNGMYPTLVSCFQHFVLKVFLVSERERCYFVFKYLAKSCKLCQKLGRILYHYLTYGFMYIQYQNVVSKYRSHLPVTYNHMVFLTVANNTELHGLI